MIPSVPPRTLRAALALGLCSCVVATAEDAAPTRTYQLGFRLLELAHEVWSDFDLRLAAQDELVRLRNAVGQVFVVRHSRPALFSLFESAALLIPVKSVRMAIDTGSGF